MKEEDSIYIVRSRSEANLTLASLTSSHQPISSFWAPINALFHLSLMISGICIFNRVLKVSTYLKEVASGPKKGDGIKKHGLQYTTR